MKNIVLAVTAIGALGLAGCTTDQALLGGAATGAAVGAVATHSVVGAVVGAGIGAFAGWVLVTDHHNGMCTYRHDHRLSNNRCH